MIGLIFGETDFPKAILQNIRKKKIKYLIIDLSKKKIYKKFNNSHVVSIGEFGKIVKILKVNKCKKVLFAGKVLKPHFSKLRLDIKGVFYFPRIIKSSKLGDAALLKEIIKILKEEKIQTISSIAFNPELTLKKGNYSKIKPDHHDFNDIKIGLKVLNNLNKYNFSQGAVVRKKRVIAIEGKGGTKKMLQKCKSKIVGKAGVLIKFPKKKQDLRIDLPTVGLKTLIQCKNARVKGIVLKNKQHVFLEQKKSIKFANKNKMFITVK